MTIETEIKSIGEAAAKNYAELKGAVEGKADAATVARLEAKAIELETKLADEQSARHALEVSHARLEARAGSAAGQVDLSEVKSAFKSWVQNPASQEAKSALLSIKANNTYEGPNGGFSVPEIISDLIKTAPVAQSVIRELSTVVTFGKGSIYKEVIEVDGANAAWVSEGGSRNATTGPVFDVAIPAMGILVSKAPVTTELLEDSAADFTQFMFNTLARGFAKKEAAAFIAGTGASVDPLVASQPQGLLTSPKLRTINSGNANSLGTNTAVSDKLLDLTSEVDADFHEGAVFIMNAKTKVALSKVKNAEGDYIFKDSVVAGVPSTLWGYPVRIDAHMPNIGAGAVPVIFGNLRDGYLIADKVGLSFITDNITNLAATNFIGRKRVGGTIRDARALAGLKVAA